MVEEQVLEQTQYDLDILQMWLEKIDTRVKQFDSEVKNHSFLPICPSF